MAASVRLSPPTRCEFTQFEGGEGKKSKVEKEAEKVHALALRTGAEVAAAENEARIVEGFGALIIFGFGVYLAYNGALLAAVIVVIGGLSVVSWVAKHIREEGTIYSSSGSLSRNYSSVNVYAPTYGSGNPGSSIYVPSSRAPGHAQAAPGNRGALMPGSAGSAAAHAQPLAPLGGVGAASALSAPRSFSAPAALGAPAGAGASSNPQDRGALMPGSKVHK